VVVAGHTVAAAVVVGRPVERSLDDNFEAAMGQAGVRAWVPAGEDAADVEEGHDAVDRVDRADCSAIVDRHNHLQQEGLAGVAVDQELEGLYMAQTVGR